MPKLGFQRITMKSGRVVFRAQLSDPTTGRRHSITADSPAELEIARRKFREARAGIRAGIPASALQAGLPGHVDPARARVRDLWEGYLASRQDEARSKAESYARRNLDLRITYRGSRLQLFDLAASELTAPLMGLWVVEARRSGGLDGKGRSWSTIKTAYAYLSACYFWNRLNPPWAPWKPVRGKPEPRNGPRPIMGSWEEARALVVAALEEDADQLRRGTYADRGTRVLIGICTGCRNAELAALGWDDLLNFDGPGDVILTVRHQAPRAWQKRPGASDRPLTPPKGRRGVARQRSQILDPIAVDVLRRLREEQRRRGWYRPDGPIFGDPKARKWTWRTAGRAIRPTDVRRWARRAGIRDPERWTVHCLRHAMVSLSFKAGADPRTVQLRVGHADISTTMGYYHHLGYGLPRPTLGAELATPALLGPVVADGPSSPPPSLPRVQKATFEELAEAYQDARDTAPRTSPPAAEPPPEPPPEPPSDPPEPPPSGARVRRRRATFAELAEAWVRGEGRRTLMGRVLPRPREVTAEARRNGAKAYQQARYHGGDDAKRDAAAARQRSYDATIARWERELRDAERRAAGDARTSTKPAKRRRSR